MEFNDIDEDLALLLNGNDLIKEASKIADWSYRYRAIEEFFINEYCILIECGGQEIELLLDNNNKVKGILTGVNYQCLQLNNSLKFQLDNIKCITIKDDRRIKNDKTKQINKKERQ